MNMKKLLVHPVVFALLLPATAALAQQKMDDMKGMDMGMKGMDMGKKQAAPSESTHKTVGMVKKVDAKSGTVTLDHEPVKSLNWSAMTMGFKVSDKSLLDKLAEGKKVEVEFKQVGKDYVITPVK
jgi:Cu(I)/Ag(I) efflux system protein CusF